MAGITDEGDVLFTKPRQGYAVITLNRPRKYNGIKKKMYTQIRNYLESTIDDNDVKFVVITGNGRYFTAGADFVDTLAEDTSAGNSMFHFDKFVECLIKYPKPIIAVVNGPAVGIGVTILPLCDVVYASSTATFNTPFSKIGIVPEACSSFTLAISIGTAKASEMLLFNRTLNADEALQAGLVSQVFPHDNFSSQVDKNLATFADLPIESLIHGKRLMRDHDRDLLLKKHKEEVGQLVKQFTSGVFNRQLEKLMQERMKKKSKL